MEFEKNTILFGADPTPRIVAIELGETGTVKIYRREKDGSTTADVEPFHPFVWADSDVVDIDFDVWDRVMTVNLRGYVAAMKYAIPKMLTRGGGVIVNMSSAAAFQGEPARPAYATAKAGIGALTRHVASRWGKEGIRCNAVAPGFTATEAIRSVPQWPDLEAGALKRIRGPRVGDPGDIAALVAFLLSDEGAWINGQVVNIDGGTVLR